MTKKAQREFGELGQQIRKQRALEPYKVKKDNRGKRPVKVDDTRQLAIKSLQADFGIQDAILPALSIAIETANEVEGIFDGGGTWEDARMAGVKTNEFWKDQTMKVRDANLMAFNKMNPEQQSAAIHLMTVATGGDPVVPALVAFIGWTSEDARKAVRSIKEKLMKHAP